MTNDEQGIRWLGAASDHLLEFSDEPRRSAGFLMAKAQAGLESNDWKLFDDVGAGPKEIRIREANGIYRVRYVAKFEAAVFVLHCFQKSTQATTKQGKAMESLRNNFPDWLHGPFALSLFRRWS